MASRAEQTALNRRSGPPRGWRFALGSGAAIVSRASSARHRHQLLPLGLHRTVAGDRQFESISLQRRVSCEPDFLDEAPKICDLHKSCCRVVDHDEPRPWRATRAIFVPTSPDSALLGSGGCGLKRNRAGTLERPARAKSAHRGKPPRKAYISEEDYCRTLAWKGNRR
jgi:hypothetical protein